MKTKTTHIFRTALLALEAAKKHLELMEGGNVKRFPKEEQEAASQLVIECAAMVNLFPLSRLDQDDEDAQGIAMDAESIREELELMAENCEAITG